MIDKAFRYTALTLQLLEKILGSNFTVNGIENFQINQFIWLITLRVAKLLSHI